MPSMTELPPFFDRSRARPRRWRVRPWVAIGAVWLIAIALGIVGYTEYFNSIGEPRSFLTVLYLTAELFTLYDAAFTLNDRHNWQLEIARFLAPSVAGYTGLRALTLLFSEQVQTFRLQFLRDHLIVCGLGQKGWLLANRFLERGHAVVVIERDLSNGLTQQAKRRGMFVLAGDATEPEMLLRAGILRASGLIAVCGDDDNNAEIAILAHGLAENRRPPLKTLTHLIDPQLCDLFKKLEIGSERAGGFRLQFFNVFDGGARAVLQDHPPFASDPAEARGAPHLLVVGMGHVGQRIVFHAARQWQSHFSATGQRLGITMLDPEAEQIEQLLVTRYPGVAASCVIRALPIGAQSADFHQGRFLLDAEEQAEVTIAYVCLDDDAASVSASLVLRQQVQRPDVPIIVCLSGSHGLAALLKEAGTRASGLSGLQAFRVLDRACTPSMLLDSTHEILARAHHEDFLRHELAAGRSREANPAIVPWEELPEHIRELNRRAVDHIPAKLRAVGGAIEHLTDWDAELFEFTPAEVELLSEMEHERWAEERIRGGWKHGPVRNDVEKLHPDLVPWDELTEEIKDKDRQFIYGLPAYLASVGFQIVRHP